MMAIVKIRNMPPKKHVLMVSCGVLPYFFSHAAKGRENNVPRVCMADNLRPAANTRCRLIPKPLHVVK